MRPIPFDHDLVKNACGFRVSCFGSFPPITHRRGLLAFFRCHQRSSSKMPTSGKPLTIRLLRFDQLIKYYWAFIFFGVASASVLRERICALPSVSPRGKESRGWETLDHGLDILTLSTSYHILLRLKRCCLPSCLLGGFWLIFCQEKIKNKKE